MKTFKRTWGMNYGLFFLIIFFLIFFKLIFPQFLTQAFGQPVNQDPLNLLNPDSTLSFASPRDTTKKDSSAFLQSFASTDTTTELLPNIKLDYASLEVKLEINTDEQYTKSREVRLSLISPYAREILIGNEPDLSDGKWEPFQSPKSWILQGEDGFQTVYFQARYPDNSVSSVVFDQIILDSTSPVAHFDVKPDSGIAGETTFFFRCDSK